MLNEKVFKPPSLVAEITDNKNNLFDYEPLHRGIYVSRTFDIPHQITVIQTNFPRIKFADEKAIGAILYVLDDVASEVLTVMNVYDPDYLESDLESFIPNESNKMTSENEDIIDENEIAEDDHEAETQNDDVVEEQFISDDLQTSFVNDEELSAEEKENLAEDDLLAESCSENTDDYSVAEAESVSPEINSTDEVEVEDKEYDQEEFEEQDDEIESEIEDEYVDQEEGEDQEIDLESSPTSNAEVEHENFVEETNKSVVDFATDESVIDFASDISSDQQAEFTEIQQHPEVMPETETLISGAAILLEKLSMFTEDRKRTPYLTSPINVEASAQTTSEAESLRDYSLTAPAA